MLIPPGRCQQRSQLCLIGATENSNRAARNEKSVGLERTLRIIGGVHVAKTQRGGSGVFSTWKLPRKAVTRMRDNANRTIRGANVRYAAFDCRATEARDELCAGRINKGPSPSAASSSKGANSADS
jgi:hypothetical protein